MWTVEFLLFLIFFWFTYKYQYYIAHPPVQEFLALKLHLQDQNMGINRLIRYRSIGSGSFMVQIVVYVLGHSILPIKMEETFKD